MRKIVFLFILFIIFIISFSFAHSGRTDSNGGHYDRSTGIYHYHNNYYVQEDNQTEKYTTGELTVKDTTNDLQEQIYSKQNTINKLNNSLVEKNEEIEKMKNTQEVMWISFIFIFLLGICFSYKIGKNKGGK